MSVPWRPLIPPLGGTRPPASLGVAVAACAVALATGTIYALKQVAPAVSLSVVYLPAVLLVSAYWGLWLGLGTSLLSAAAFNFFHIPPVGRFTIADSRNWVALGAFTIVSIVASAMAGAARRRTLEAERSRGEADLAAALARALLGGEDLRGALATTARVLAGALGLASASIELGALAGDARRRAVAVRGDDGAVLATILVPAGLPGELMERLRSNVAPTMAALIGVALRREAIQAAAVQTEALRRSDDVKTALLRAVSHDLRTPLTAIVAAGHALLSGSLSGEERVELSGAVIEQGERLARLVDQLLDLSKLQAGRAQPRPEWVALEEVVLAAQSGLGDGEGDRLRVVVDPDLPDVRADAAQLERALANLIENARRYGRGAPVSVRARRVGERVVVSVVDQGPGIAPRELERIFEPFYRGERDGAGAPAARAWPGSGLGLAIARGFVEANGGTIAVESLPGQGTTFVVSLPIAGEEPAGLPG